ncbi:ABC transporter ATP-binding protein [Clostridium sp. 'deep sea']|nr:ABC transporter ATP-binding protein [Clostridium sp. 'deep sea']
MIGSVLLAVLSVLFGLVPYYAVSKLLIGILDSSNKSLQFILLWVGIAIIGFILKIVLYGRATLLSHKAAFEILKNIRSAIAGKLARTSMGYLQSKPSGEFKQLIVDEVEKLEYPLAHAIPEFTSNLLGPIIIAAYLFTVDWRIALLALSSIPVGFLIYMLMMVGRGTMYENFIEANAHMNATVVEYINGIEVIKSFNQTASSMKRYENAVTNFHDLTVKWYKHCWPYLSGYAVVMPSGIAAALPVGTLLLARGSLGLSAFLTGIILTLGLVGPIMKLVEFSDNLVTIMDTETKIHTMLSTEELPQPEKPVKLNSYDVVFQDVQFSYGKEQVLKGISFMARAGTITAVVGPSGSGKSTIARLLARFWDVEDGEVTLGGVNIKEMPVSQLMDCISYVSQENFLLDMSIEENIRIGKPTATKMEIESAAEKAGCAEFIGRFPEGYATRVGDAGDRLSGGERQRIAIARAILKNAPIVLLDEATAFTDPENENKIQTSIGNLVKGKTLIIIAHRLSTIMYADNILVVKDGKVKSQGTHEELLQSSQLYQNMWQEHIEAIEWSMKEEVQGYVESC